LDHRLIDFAFGLPDNQRIQNGVAKVILRRAMAELLPTGVLERKDKKGYPTPATTWMRNDLADAAADLIHSRSFAERGVFRANEVRERFARFRRGEIAMPELSRCLGVELWMRMFLDKAAGPSLTDTTPTLTLA
jgi:asparagine synthase (glutamine-hydrolysing)